MRKYSFSQIKTVRRCPYMYDMCYNKHHKMKGSIFTFFGQAIHNLMKDVFTKNMSRGAAIANWENYFAKEINQDCEEGHVKYHANVGFLVIKGYPFINLFFKNRDSLDIVEILSVECKEEMMYDGNVFIYICDLIYKNSKGETVLLDYKTGKKREVDKYQVEFYSWQDKFKIDKLCLFYFKDYVMWDRGENKEKVERFVNEAVHAIEIGNYFKIVTNECDKCDLFLQKLCDAKVS